MGNVKIAVHANESVEMLRAGTDGSVLWLFGLMYASRQRPRTGFVPEQALPEIYNVRHVKALAVKLVDVGLWDRTNDGYQIRFELCAFGAQNDQTTWSTENYAAVYERDGRRCRYCGRTDDPTIDHVVPRCQGGSDEIDNLVVACRKCNCRKGGRTPAQAGMVLS